MSDSSTHDKSVVEQAAPSSNAASEDPPPAWRAMARRLALRTWLARGGHDEQQVRLLTASRMIALGVIGKQP